MKVVYYIVFFFWYLLSLLPLRFLYIFPMYSTIRSITVFAIDVRWFGKTSPDLSPIRMKKNLSVSRSNIITSFAII